MPTTTSSQNSQSNVTGLPKNVEAAVEKYLNIQPDLQAAKQPVKALTNASKEALDVIKEYLRNHPNAPGVKLGARIIRRKVTSDVKINKQTFKNSTIFSQNEKKQFIKDNVFDKESFPITGAGGKK